LFFIAGLILGSSFGDLVKYFGEEFWSLIPFTMQIVMIIVGGYVVAGSPLVYRLISRLASVPITPRGAVAFGGVVLMWLLAHTFNYLPPTAS
jgi:short-chain fatty acids transporter